MVMCITHISPRPWPRRATTDPRGPWHTGQSPNRGGRHLRRFARRGEQAAVGLKIDPPLLTGDLELDIAILDVRA